MSRVKVGAEPYHQVHFIPLFCSDFLDTGCVRFLGMGNVSGGETQF